MSLYCLSAIMASNTRGQQGAKSREYTTRMRHVVQLATMTTLSATSTRQGVTEPASKRRHSVEERRLHTVRTGRSCLRMVRRNGSRSPGVGERHLPRALSSEAVSCILLYNRIDIIANKF
jgi:hypothetical protein